MRLGRTLSILALTSLFAATAAEAGRSKFRKGPYLQQVTTDSVRILWEADRARSAVVRVEGPPPIVVESPADWRHEVLLENLAADTLFHYEVEMAGEVLKGSFSTAPEGDTPFLFVVYGDSRSRPSDHRAVVATIADEVPDFMVSTGDLVNRGDKRRDWRRFFEIEGTLLRDHTLFPALGNHDRQGDNKPSSYYRKLFSVPENSPRPESYYSFTYGNARVIVLDSNQYHSRLEEETAWLETELAEAKANEAIRHVFVSMHHPPFSVSSHGGNARIRDAWCDLFESYAVTAVFSGHDHVYSRFEQNGVPYFVTGGAGAPLYPRRNRPGSIDEQLLKAFERVNHYLRVEVSGPLVDVTAVRVDGSVIETVQVAKPAVAQKKPEEKAPAIERAVAEPAPPEREPLGARPPPKAVAIPDDGPETPPSMPASTIAIGFVILLLLGALGWSLH